MVIRTSPSITNSNVLTTIGTIVISIVSTISTAQRYSNAPKASYKRNYSPKPTLRSKKMFYMSHTFGITQMTLNSNLMPWPNQRIRFVKRILCWYFDLV